MLSESFAAMADELCKLARVEVRTPSNNCFFYSAAMAALDPKLRLMKGSHTGQHSGDSAHFYVQNKDGTVTDPTGSQYRSGHLVPGEEVSVRKNLDYLIGHPLFKTLDKSDQKKIIGLEKVSYKLQGHMDVQGIPIAIENRKGSVRKGTDSDGHEWRTEMKAPYGYVKGTKGKDGEEIDAYVGPKLDAPDAYVVHQHNDDGKGHDEDKIIFSVESKEEAKKLYLQHYDDPKFLGPISKVPLEKIREIIDSGKKVDKLTADA
jgi:hypothetical protein